MKKSKQQFEVRYRQRGGLGKCSSLLVYDTFEAHMTENVKVVFAKENSNLALIPVLQKYFALFFQFIRKRYSDVVVSLTEYI